MIITRFPEAYQKRDCTFEKYDAMKRDKKIKFLNKCDMCCHSGAAIKTHNSDPYDD